MAQKDWHKLLKTVEDDVLIAQSVIEAIGSGTIVPSLLRTKATIKDYQAGRLSSFPEIGRFSLKTWRVGRETFKTPY